MNVGYITDMGDNRPINQDSLYVDKDLGLFILADGMGGHNVGEVAGKIAVEVAAKSIRAGLESGKEITLIFREAVSEANKSI